MSLGTLHLVCKQQSWFFRIFRMTHQRFENLKTGFVDSWCTMICSDMVTSAPISIFLKKKIIQKVSQLQVGTTRTKSDIERLVWSDHKPYIPRPLLSMHVRMGDKACEMAVVGFEEYMELAGNLRKQFPGLKNIWLSTEMQVSQFPHPV